MVLKFKSGNKIGWVADKIYFNLLLKIEEEAIQMESLNIKVSIIKFVSYGLIQDTHPNKYKSFASHKIHNWYFSSPFYFVL